MQTKAEIQVGDLVMNLEGSENFVSAQMERFASLILARTSTPPGRADEPEIEAAESELPSAKEGKPKKARSSTGAGAGCAAKVKALLADGFFAAGQSTGQVETRLREQATPYSKSKISAALISLAKRKILRRYQENGEWLYMVP